VNHESPLLQPTLEKDHLYLRPLEERDFDPLHSAASDSKIWDQHFEPNRHDPKIFRKFFDAALLSKGALVIIDQLSHQIIGTSRYYHYDPIQSELEIGYTFITRPYWKTSANSEIKKLMIDHAFTFVDSVLFYVWENNFRSQKAVEKLGATKQRLIEGPSHHSFEYRLKKNDWKNQTL
jgi:RimJ/RimL family protein N-acetyltransferase